MHCSFLVCISPSASGPGMESRARQWGWCELQSPSVAGFSTWRWETTTHDVSLWFSVVWRLKQAHASSQKPCWEHREELWGGDWCSPTCIQPAGEKLKWARWHLRQDHPHSFLRHFVCLIHPTSKTSTLSSHGWATVPSTHLTSSTGAAGPGWRVLSWTRATCQGLPSPTDTRKAEYLWWKPWLMLCALRPFFQNKKETLLLIPQFV